jgi:hypothetical protein
MQDRKFILAITVAVVTAMTIPTGLAAQDATTPVKKTQHHHYELIDVGTLGGVNSYLNFQTDPLNHSGAVVGESQTAVPLPANTDAVGVTQAALGSP